LGRDAETWAELRQWHALRIPLETRYHAPPIIDWITMPAVALEGLLFAWIEGSSPDLAHQPALCQAVVQVMGQLHQDQELAAQLRPTTPPRTCFDTFRDTYIDRFVGDLVSIRSALPPFVAPATLAWMEQETQRLEELARSSVAFQQSANAPIHGDLQHNNLLATVTGQWFILDWDDLQLGDPALDYTTLLAPPLAHWQPDHWPLALLPVDEALHERLALYQRAHLLDWVIDVLADYVEAEVAAAHQAEVRATKQQQHSQALALYQQYYG
jgi:thiamine kinase-like enzyme